MNKNTFLENRYDPKNNRTIFYDKDIRLQAILSLVDSCTQKVDVLDVGCYTGEIGELIKNKIGRNCQVYGIDIAQNTAAEAESRGIIFKVNDLNQRIDYPDNKFDLVFAGEIIEHIYDTDFFISEIKRILKPGGKMIITTPNFVSLGRRIMYLFGKGAFMEASLSFPRKPEAAGHIRFFTKKLLKDFMAKNKFELLEYISDTVNFPGFKINFLAKFAPTIGHSIICKFINLK